ncbi:MAG: molybdopterin-dependent oxidoreductase [Planctomycetota bacterium]
MSDAPASATETPKPASITVEGRTCEFDPDARPSLLQVALEAGVEIPHYCYHPGMSVVASCRICLAEVSQPNPRNNGALELIPKLVPTCQTPAVDGAVVHLQSPKTVANQKAVMEYLLINHPLDCPVCDQAGECSLQDYSYRYGNSSSRFQEDKIKQPKKDLGAVLLYSDRCIMCSRCVRFTKEVTGTNEIGIFGRGSEEQIDVFPGKPLDNPLAGNVVDICPVGALLDKDFLMSMRVWNLTKTPSIDGITASGDNLSVETNDGKVYRIKPRTNLDVNQWWTSDEIRYGWKHVQSPDRLTTPMVKRHGTHEAVDFNTAYDTLLEKLEVTKLKKGPGSLAVVVSPMLSCEEASLLGQLAKKLDPQAVLAVGPVPIDGEDQTFPGGYTVRAEKAPNARGVRRALEQVADHVLAFDQLDLSSVHAVVLTGNYPEGWITDDFEAALSGKFVALLDTLPNALVDAGTGGADVVLPGATWLEKAGTFENADGRLQTFEAAIPVREGTKSEGQLATDLLARLEGHRPGKFDAAATREALGGVFITDVHHPTEQDVPLSEVEFVAL